MKTTMFQLNQRSKSFWQPLKVSGQHVTLLSKQVGFQINIFFCELCRADLSCAHKGVGDVNVHIASRKHVAAAGAIRQTSTLSLDRFLVTEKPDQSVINAEVLFTGFVIEHNLPISISEHSGSLFRRMFPDSEIAAKYSCSRTKTSHIISDAIAPDSKGSLISSVHSIYPWFCLATDGSSDNDDKYFPVLLRHISCLTGLVITSLLDMPVCNDATGENIFEAMLSSLQANGIGIDKCIGYSSDNASVMTGKQKGVLGRLLTKQPKLISFGCPCHLLHLAASSGAKMLGFNSEDLLIDIYYHFDKSVNRKQKFREFSEFAGEDVRKILKHVSTRWLSLSKCIDRVLMKWNSLVGYFITNFDEDGEEEWPTQRRRKVSVQNESREKRLVKLFKDPLTKVYLLFLSAVLPMFDILNQLLQSDEPQIHILHPCMMKLYRKLLKCFVHPHFVSDEISNHDILQLNVEDEAIHFSDQEIFVGFLTVQALKAPEISLSSRSKFYKEVISFYSKVILYMNKKFPSKDEILENVTFIDPRNRTRTCFEQLTKLMSKLLTVVLEENMNDLHQEFLEYRTSNESLNEERIDEYWERMSKKIDPVTLKPIFQNLVSLVKLILVIPHSNAFCDIVFSMVKKVQTDARSQLGKNTKEGRAADSVYFEETGVRNTLCGLLMSKVNIFCHTKCYEWSPSPELLRQAHSATYKNLCSRK